MGRKRDAILIYSISFLYQEKRPVVPKPQNEPKRPVVPKPRNEPKYKKMHLTCILLAAGLSQRMGTANKLLLPYQHQTILTATLHQLQQSQIEEIIVVTGFEQAKIEKILEDFTNIQIKHNDQYTKGMTSSIQCGLQVISSQTKGIMIALGDMPLLQAEDYNLLIQHFRQACQKEAFPIIRPMNEKQIGHPVIFQQKYVKDLLQYKGKNGCKAVITAHKSHLIRMESQQPAYFRDIDTPSEYQKWKQ